MRRSLVLAAVFAAMGILAGCGNSSGKGAAATAAQGGNTAAQQTAGTETQAAPETGDKQLTVFWWGNQVRNERTQIILDMFAEEHPGVKLDGQFADGSAYWTRLATLSAGHTMPDVIQMDYSYLQQYVDNGLLVDLTPYIEDGTIDVENVSSDILNTAKVGDGIYGVANGINSPALFYNKTALDAAGIEVHDNMTLEEFKALCREVYEKTGYKTGLDYGAKTDLQGYLLRAHDRHSYDGNSLGVKSAEDYLEYFSLYETGREEGWLIDPSVYVERQIASVEQDCLVYGSSPESMSWCAFYNSNQLAAMQSAAPEGVEIGITTWPSADPKKSNYLKPSQFFSLSTDGENPETGAELIDYITNSEACNNVLLGERGVPVSSVVAKAITASLPEDEQRAVAYINEVVTPNSSQIDAPGPQFSSEINALNYKLVEKVMYGELSAADAAAQLYEGALAIAEKQ